MLRVVPPGLVVCAALAFAACGRERDARTGTTETTGAVVASTPAAPIAPAAAPSIDAPAEAAQPPVEQGVQGSLPDDTGPAEPPYARAPLRGSGGATVSDVGMPYPLPSASLDPSAAAAPAPPRSSQQTRPPAPFFESSFGPPLAPGAYSESSFGPDAGL